MSYTDISAISTMNTIDLYIAELFKIKANVRIYDFMLELKIDTIQMLI